MASVVFARLSGVLGEESCALPKAAVRVCKFWEELVSAESGDAVFDAAKNFDGCGGGGAKSAKSSRSVFSVGSPSSQVCKRESLALLVLQGGFFTAPEALVEILTARAGALAPFALTFEEALAVSARMATVRKVILVMKDMDATNWISDLRNNRNQMILRKH